MTVEELLPRLDGVRPNGKGWTARCPAHEDRNASLSIGVGDEEKVLLKCFAGCGLDAILTALDLAAEDLFPDRVSAPRRRGVPPWERSIRAAFDYRDATGALLFQVVRFADEQGEKCRPRFPDPSAADGWSWKARKVERPLYCLPELIDAVKARKTILFPEGEKDVETLRAQGFSATTNPGGAEGWKQEYAECFRGANVVLLPDNDGPGRKHVETVARSLLGIAERVRVLELPGLSPKGDVSDWFESGGTSARLKELAREAPEWKAEAGGAPETFRFETEKGRGLGKRSERGYRFESVGTLLDEPEEEVRWVVEGMLPTGGTSLFIAKPKVGKSTLTRQLALCVARGESFLGRATHRGPVLILAFEEKRGEARRHLAAMGARHEDDVHLHFGGPPENAISELRKLIAKVQPALVIVDTLFRLCGVKDSNDYTQVLKALTPLTDLARDSGVHVSAVHHAGKGEREGGDAILGSTAIFGSVDTAVILKRAADSRSIYSVQRYGEDLPESVLSFDRVSRIASLAGTRSEAEEARIESEILSAIGKDPIEEEKLLADVEGRTGAKRKALRELVRCGSVARIGGGKRGDPFKYGIPIGSDGDPSSEPDAPAIVSRFSFPPIRRDEKTSIELEALKRLQERRDSRSDDSRDDEISGTSFDDEVAL